MNILTKGKAVHFDDRYLHVELEDGRVILTPMSWYKELQTATFKQLTNYQLMLRSSKQKVYYLRYENKAP